MVGALLLEVEGVEECLTEVEGATGVALAPQVLFLWTEDFIR